MRWDDRHILWVCLFSARVDVDQGVDTASNLIPMAFMGYKRWKAVLTEDDLPLFRKTQLEPGYYWGGGSRNYVILYVI